MSESWAPGERPAWVSHALAGEAGPIYEHAQRPFVADELMAEAVLRAGADDFDGDSFREPLDVVVHGLEHQADLHLVGRWRAREVVIRYLENRLRIAAALRADPGIAAEVIGAPIVVTGSPRAGTSIMHQLLSLGEGMRAPLAWEYWAPAPPPRTNLPRSGVKSRTGQVDPRVALANADVRLSAALAPSFDGMHEQGGLVPREDGSAFSVDFRGDVLPTHYGLWSYQQWLNRCDMSSGYHWHRRILQVLQRHIPTERWVLKWPTYVSSLPTLLTTYPDVRVVVCHRDPVAMLSSVTSLTATLRWAHLDRVDYAEVARQQTETFGRQCDLLVEADRSGVLPAGQVAHVRFDEFMADQPAMVASSLERLEVPLSSEHHERVVQHLAANPKGRLGGHRHRADDLGLDLGALDDRFAAYRDHFGIEREAAS